MQAIPIGFSPCPNDTFIFHALVHQKVDTGGLRFEPLLEDVETLNCWALEGRLAFTKLSFATLLRVFDQYRPLLPGCAMGKGVGPILVARTQRSLSDVAAGSIAIPGELTTANMLLQMAFPDAKRKTAILFSQIEDEVLSGAFDFGLLIHESRFTYERRGLKRVLDLGDWWERHTGEWIPLGCIAVRRDVPEQVGRQVSQSIARSIAYAWQQYPNLPPFVQKNAQEMEESVMRRHIELYVSRHADDTDRAARTAIERLFAEAVSAGILPSKASLSPSGAHNGDDTSPMFF